MAADNPPARPPGAPKYVTLDAAILAAARRHLGERGSTGMSIQGVAAAVGSSVPSLRRTYRDKLELAIATIVTEQTRHPELLAHPSRVRISPSLPAGNSALHRCSARARSTVWYARRRCWCCTRPGTGWLRRPWPGAPGAGHRGHPGSERGARLGHEPVGAAVAAWPAASLVGSYELLLWLIRTAAAGAVAREPTADQVDEPADHSVTGLRLVSLPDLDAPGDQGAPGSHVRLSGPGDRCVGPVAGTEGVSGPGQHDSGHAYRTTDRQATGSSPVDGVGATIEDSDEGIDMAAVAAYRASIDMGRPLSERKLAAMFGKTSRRVGPQPDG
jgi:AcrR family transcriptional regulator